MASPIDTIQHATLDYASEANYDVGGDSDGTTILVIR